MYNVNVIQETHWKHNGNEKL